MVPPQFDVIGTRLPRLDAVDKVTGAIRYVGDLQIPGVFAGKLVHSTTAHARIVSLNIRAAQLLPGVRAVITGRDMPTGRYGQTIKDATFLPTDKVRYYGEPVAAVAAVDEATAEQAVSLIEVEYEQLPVLGQAEDALRPGAPLVHEDFDSYEVVATTGASPLPAVGPSHGTNVLYQIELHEGDVADGFNRSHRVLEETYSVPMVAHAAMEPHACAAEAAPGGTITVWSCTQTVSRVHSWLAEYFGVPESNVRVIGVKPGGAFGGKIGVILEPYCVALSLKAGGPVRIVLTRVETSYMIGGWLPATFKFKTGVAQDGQMVARQIDVLWNAGAHANMSPIASANAALLSLGPYRTRHVALNSRLVYTNLPGARPYRGLAATQANWAAERHVDSVASMLGIDPLEFRLRNCLEPGDPTPWGEVNTDIRIKECLREAAAAVEWDKPVPGTAVGRGIAAMWKFTLPGFIAQVEVRLLEDGSVDVYSGTIDIGTGIEVVIAQIASETLGVPVDRVRVHMGDTAFSLLDSGAAASRSAVYAGNATLQAASQIRDKVLQLASQELGVSSVELELTQQRVQLRTSPAVGVTLSQLLAGEGELVSRSEFRGEVHTHLTPQSPTGWRFADWKFGAAAALVSVDVETGKVLVNRVAVANDIGRILNRLNVETQAHGCVAMAVGAAIYEHEIFDEAQIINPDFMEYVMPTALEVPSEIVPIFLEPATGHGPFGSKGYGELPIIAVGAAIGNAVANAVGVQIRDLPITAEKVLRELDKRE